MEAADALEKMADKTGYSLIYPFNLSKKVSTNPVIGRYSLPDALEILLFNSPLKAIATQKRVIAVSKKNIPPIYPLTPQDINIIANTEISNKVTNVINQMLLKAKTDTTDNNEAIYETLADNQFFQRYEVIEVKGIRGSLKRSMMQKRLAIGVSDAISAEDLGKFPDLNMSESLQRMPGVTLNRNTNGEGQAVNLRGLDPQFTRIEVNGMSGTANGTGGRFSISSGQRGFNFEILASELFSNVTVSKSSNASQVEGGMAGIISLETPKPLSYQGTKGSISLQGNHSEKLNKTNPRTSLLLSHNIDDMVGMLFSLAYSDTDFRSDSAESGVWRKVPGRANGKALVANGTRYFNFLEDRSTLGSTFTLQYRLSDNIEFSLDTIYAKLDSHRIANRNDMPIENPGPTTSAIIEDGIVTSGSFTDVQQRVGTNLIDTDEDFLQLSLKTEWLVDDNWQITPFIGYSKRKSSRNYNLYSFRLADEQGFDPGTVFYNVRGDFVDFSSSHTDFNRNPEDFLFNIFIYRPSNDMDQETSAKLDFQRYFDFDGLESIEFGFRYADRDKDRIQTQYRLQRNVDDLTIPPNLASVAQLLPFNVAGVGANAANNQLSVDANKVNEVFFPNGDPINGTEIRLLPGFNAAESWGIQEKTFNAYLQANFIIDKATFNAGLRLVHTQQISTGSMVANRFLPSEKITPLTVKTHYTKYLPSFNLRYDLEQDLLLRAAYSQTLTRPDLSSIAPSETVNGIDEGGGTGRSGNPQLRPFIADNFDLGLEWYFQQQGILSASLFYKDISGLIDIATFTENRTFPRQSDGKIVNAPIVFSTFANDASAEINGIELSYQQPFNFTDISWLNFWGALINYTYADSSADFGIEGDVRSSGLPGLSRKSLNASLYYDDGQLDARLSYAWRERYLAQFIDDFGVPRFVNDFGQLDLSANYRINNNFQLQMQILNITKEQFINQATARYLPFGVSDLDRRILIGARYSF